ncbi:MAG: 16S rRNA (cytidine(1402)-2'-O)-methyltransferase [Chlorobi bacterium]|nr:16S rRNA (cytidine(1402)-2'-O)-methyltransferase [Chlorobiota bacterium]
MAGKLFLVSVPIGNKKDITLRALERLSNSHFIICEELKPARRLLAGYKITKELIPLNEHNEEETVPEIISLLKEGKNLSLISDAGTPLFSDPGKYLVKQCIDSKIDVSPLPGANSILPALITSGFDVNSFFYYGWLSPKKDLRRKELLKLKRIKETIVIMETPYRLKTILSDIKKTFGENFNISLAYKLTMPEELILRGAVKTVLAEVEKRNLKGEFVLIVNNKFKHSKRI